MTGCVVLVKSCWNDKDMYWFMSRCHNKDIWKQCPICIRNVI